MQKHMKVYTCVIHIVYTNIHSPTHIQHAKSYESTHMCNTHCVLKMCNAYCALSPGIVRVEYLDYRCSLVSAKYTDWVCVNILSCACVNILSCFDIFTCSAINSQTQLS